MAKFRIDSLGELARQMPFTPHDTRLTQIVAAEELLHTIDPAKAYPREFVVFRITGYRPKTVADDLLTGIALQHDLGLLIESVSDTLNLYAPASGEPVLAIEDVCERFNVTSKTIQRWRRKGLPARRFTFADGKRRVGFLLNSVERFFAAHGEQVVRGTNFSLVSDSERDEIIRRARRLAGSCRCCSKEISRRIARRLNRSPATILHTIRRHDQERPDEAVFPLAAAEIAEAERGRILRAARRGHSLKAMVRRSCRTRAAVYRVILEDRVERLSRRKVKFIDDPLYHQSEAAETIDAIAAQDGELGAGSAPESNRVPRDLPPYLQELYRTPLLSAGGERALFLKFNFHKFGFIAARRRLEPQFAHARDINLLESQLRRATEVKNQIVRANLRLVVSVARKHLRPGLSLMELISEGNLTLMRAVDSFDAHRGYRFSTYATFALMKGFARSVPQMLAARSAGNFDVSALADIPDPRPLSDRQQFADREQVGHLLSRLDERERTVLLAYYGLNGQDAPATYDQVGQRLGLSKQRVRQIERNAVAKLRESAQSLS